MPKPTISLCVLAGGRIRWLTDAIVSACQYLEPDELIVSVAPHVDWSETEDEIRGRLDRMPKVVSFEGFDRYERMAWYRFRQFDRATCDWIFNLDDDDGVIGAIDWENVCADEGVIHSDILGLCHERSGHYMPGDTLLRRARQMRRPQDADWFKGSFWGVSRSAWQSVSTVVDRSALYEDWGLAYHVMRVGWGDHYIPRTLQFQRLRDWQAAVERQRATGYVWADELRSLDRKFGRDAPEHRFLIETDPEPNAWWEIAPSEAAIAAATGRDLDPMLAHIPDVDRAVAYGQFMRAGRDREFVIWNLSGPSVDGPREFMGRHRPFIYRSRSMWATIARAIDPEAEIDLIDNTLFVRCRGNR